MRAKVNSVIIMGAFQQSCNCTCALAVAVAVAGRSCSDCESAHSVVFFVTSPITPPPHHTPYAIIYNEFLSHPHAPVLFILFSAGGLQGCLEPVFMYQAYLIDGFNKPNEQTMGFRPYGTSWQRLVSIQVREKRVFDQFY
jgi:hypothetical protein